MNHFPRKRLDLPGQILLTWFWAGALITGGVLVAYATLQERMNYYQLLNTVAILYGIGGVLGLLLGGAVGMFGRPLQMRAERAFRDQLNALLYLLPVAAVGFVLAGWVGFTFAALQRGDVVPLVLVSAAWAASLVIVSFAAARGWLGIEHIAERARGLPRLRIQVEFPDEERGAAEEPEETGDRGPERES